MREVFIPVSARPWRFYAWLGALAAGIAITGFWASYFGPLVRGIADAPGIIHLHAAVFVGWILLVIAQAILAATGHRALHIRVGYIGMAYGALVVVVGVITAFVFFSERLHSGQNIRGAQIQLFVPLTDLLGFAPFLVAAWFYRHRPEVHKRLIIVATTVLLIAAVHRIPFFATKPAAPWIVLAIWLSPIYLAMVVDFARSRMVHPVYLIGIAVVLWLKFGRVPIVKTEAWQNVATWLTRQVCPTCGL